MTLPTKIMRVVLEAHGKAIADLGIPRGCVWGNAVATLIERLDPIAQRLHLPRLRSFLVDPPAADARWYPPAEGLRTVRGLIATLKSDPAAAETLTPDEAHGVLWDLQIMDQLLSLAHQRNIRFHLSTG